MKQKDFYYSKELDQRCYDNHVGEDPYECATINGKKFTECCNTGVAPLSIKKCTDLVKVCSGYDNECKYGNYDGGMQPLFSPSINFNNRM